MDPGRHESSNLGLHTHVYAIHPQTYVPIHVSTHTKHIHTNTLAYLQYIYNIYYDVTLILYCGILYI